MLDKPLLESELPRFVYLGENVFDKIPDIISRLKISKNAVMFSGSSNSYQVSQSIYELLESEKYTIKTYQIKNSSLEEAQKAVEIVAEEKPSFLIAVGGGSIIDVAKYASIPSSPKLSHIPYINVPTLPSHDGIASPFIFLQDKKFKMEFYYGMAKSPLAIIADVKSFSGFHHRYLTAGIGDLIANVTALKDWQYAQKRYSKKYAFSDYAYSLSGVSAQIMIEQAPDIKPNHDESIRRVLRALFISGMAMCISQNICAGFGSEHLFALGLGRKSGKGLHGERCALGTILMSCLQKQRWQDFKALFEKLGLPTTAKKLGIAPEIIVEALIDANNLEDIQIPTILDDSKLNENSATELAIQTGVIN
ncbi:MAG: iron-containing alcohol dehydrogenase [Candidatus Hermodarchaeota archaeon]